MEKACAAGRPRPFRPRSARAGRSHHATRINPMPQGIVRPFTVLPQLPARLQALHKLAYNMWWCWNPEAISLFRRLDADLFEQVEHSPIKLLGTVEQARYEQLLHDDGFLAHLDHVEEMFDAYLRGPAWFHETHATGPDARPRTEASSR